MGVCERFFEAARAQGWGQKETLENGKRSTPIGLLFAAYPWRANGDAELVRALPHAARLSWGREVRSPRNLLAVATNVQVRKKKSTESLSKHVNSIAVRG